MVVGGGSGGCAVAAKFSRKLKKNELVIIEPAEKHYYQPMFTLVGGGIKKVDNTWKLMKDVLPKNSTWIKDSVEEFDLKNNFVRTKSGKKIKYEHMLVGVGLELQYEKVRFGNFTLLL